MVDFLHPTPVRYFSLNLLQCVHYPFRLISCGEVTFKYLYYLYLLLYMQDGADCMRSYARSQVKWLPLVPSTNQLYSQRWTNNGDD